jgi:hypothetical protein
MPDFAAGEFEPTFFSKNRTISILVGELRGVLGIVDRS